MWLLLKRGINNMFIYIAIIVLKIKEFDFLIGNV